MKSILDLATELLRPTVKSDAKFPFGTGNFRKKVASQALGVTKKAIPELRELNKTLGFGEIPITSTGEMVFDNSQTFRKYAKARGFRHYGY